VQVDVAFLTEKYCGILLTAIGQDGNQNIFSLAFSIVEGETKEVMWFSQLLSEYVMPHPNVCLIIDKRTTILLALKCSKVA